MTLIIITSDLRILIGLFGLILNILTDILMGLNLLKQEVTMNMYQPIIQFWGIQCLFQYRFNLFDRNRLIYMFIVIGSTLF